MCCMQLRTADRKPNANNESNIRNLWNNIKHANLSITGIPEGKKEKGDQKCIWRSYCWKLPKPKEGNISRHQKKEGLKQSELKQTFTKIFFFQFFLKKLFIYFLAVPCSKRDLISLTRDWTPNPFTGSTVSTTSLPEKSPKTYYN